MAEAGTENSCKVHDETKNGSDSELCPSPSEPSESVENDAFLFFSYLDEIDDRIEHLRRHAIALAQEKESLLLVLSQLKEESMTGSLTKDEFQEICVNMDRLRTRCQAVDIQVQTIRSPEQAEAFSKIFKLVSDVEKLCTDKEEKNEAFKRANSYLNACSSEGAGSGGIDYKFQGMILDCVIDDQKFIRHRLETIVRNCIQHNQQMSEHVGSNENCIKPSAIASSVRGNPTFEMEDFDDVSPKSPVNDQNFTMDNVNPNITGANHDNVHLRCDGDTVSSQGKKTVITDVPIHSSQGTNGSLPSDSPSTTRSQANDDN